MSLDFNANRYYMAARWYRRPESAAAIADRWARYVDKLSASSPLLANWVVYRKRKGLPFATARRDLVGFLQGSRLPDDDGQVYAADGFAISAYTCGQEQKFEQRGFVARYYGLGDTNDFMFTTGMGQWPDLSLVTYPLFRSAMLAAIACWEPLYCIVQTKTLQPFKAPRSWYNLAWMTYVHPSLVHRVAPPDIPVVEPTSARGSPRRPRAGGCAPPQRTRTPLTTPPTSTRPVASPPRPRISTT